MSHASNLVSTFGSFFPEAKERNLDLNKDLNNITISKENQERGFAKKLGHIVTKPLFSK